MNLPSPGDRVYICAPEIHHLFEGNVIRTGCVAALTGGEVPADTDRGKEVGIQIRNAKTGMNSIHHPSLVFTTPDEAVVAMTAFLAAAGESAKQWLAQVKGEAVDDEDPGTSDGMKLVLPPE